MRGEAMNTPRKTITLTHRQYEGIQHSVDMVREELISLLDDRSIPEAARRSLGEALADSDDLAKRLYHLAELS
jgi:hypothetical protein